MGIPARPNLLHQHEICCIYGLEATAGFVTAPVYFILETLFIGFHLEIEAQPVLNITSIITIEFILIFLSQVLPFVPLSE
jgi:hypothetical protein